MIRRSVAFVFGCASLSACGDSTHPLTDASTDSPRSIDAAPIDGAELDAFVDTSLILRYDFEDSTTVVKDSAFRHMDGTLSDVAAWTASGRNNRGLAMAGGHPATRFVSLPNGVLTGVDDFTITVWVKFNTLSATTNWARIYDFGDGPIPGADRWMFLTVNDFEGIHASSFGGSPQNENIVVSGTTGTAPTQRLPTGVWKHIALTGSGGDRKIYVDGFPAASIAAGPVVAPKEMEPLSPNSWLGKSRFLDAPDPGFDGSMDDFRIYNRVLTATEVADLAWPQHDYSYWRFDETSGSTAKDSSDNAVGAVLANGPTWTTGRLGGAINFAGGAAGANGPQVVLTSAPLANCTTSATLAAWVKIHTAVQFGHIFDFGTGGTFIYLAATDGVGMHFAMGRTATAPFDLQAPQPVPADDMWHHVAVTIDPTGLVTLFMDGAVVGTPTVSATLKPSDYTATTENYLGRSRFGGDPYLNGALDELRISCRAFTADEIKNLARP